MENNTENNDNISFIKRLNRLMLQEAEEAITLDLPGDDLPEPVPVHVDDIKGENGGAISVADVPDPIAELRVRLKLAKRNLIRRRNRMFGVKKPIVAVVGEIADTELKIAKQVPQSQQQPPLPPALGEHDMALVARFLEREGEK